MQRGGLVVLETAFGFIVRLPVGTGQISLVVITAELGRDPRKVEETGCFRSGSSDFVMRFESRCKASFNCAVQAHALQGSALGCCQR